ncbi:hypothetical protein ABMY26_00705 (plasmid) [Azospirillum sp. HJ39]|uniref:hypothetical protein n=1 Tax=Azospirillum sp. HJ39 TaxID=3159496 RepID=UPI003557E2A4
MSDLFADLQINPEEFLPVSTVNPMERANLRVVRVSVSPQQTTNKKAGARVNITFSPAVCEKLGVQVQTKAAVLMGRQAGQVLVCSPQAAKEAFPNSKLATFTVSNSGGRVGAALRKVAFATPFWCISERTEAVDVASFKLAAGALLIQLPDSFIRPEYLPQPSAIITSENTEAELPPLAVETEKAPVANSGPAVPAGDAARLMVEASCPRVEPDNIDPAPTVEPADSVPVTAGNPEVPVTSTDADPAEKPADVQVSEEEVFQQDAESLYGVLLACARQGRECPPNTTLCEALIEGVVLKSVYVTALFKHLQEGGRISFSFMDSRGKKADSYIKGRVRVVEFLTGSEKGLTTRNPFAAPTPATRTPTPATPKELPKAAVKGRGLSEAERELQEAANAGKDVTDEDFEFLKSKGVAIVRNPGNSSHPFKISDLQVTAIEVSRRARSMRLLTRKSA